VSQRALYLCFYVTNRSATNTRRPTNTITVGIQHVGEEILYQVWSVDTICQSNFTDPVFVASLFTATSGGCTEVGPSRQCYLGNDIQYLKGDLATPSAGEPRPGTERRSAHLHPPTRPDPQFREHRRALIRRRSQAVISSSSRSQLHHFL